MMTVTSNPALSYVCFGVGAFVLFKWMLLNFWNFLSFCSTPRRKLEKFGKWAVVTGATDGIGRAMAMELAHKGMAIVLIGRNQAKLDDTEKLVKGSSPNAEVKKVLADFDDPTREVYTKIENEIKHLNIGILVNNVGISYPHAMFFHEVPEDLLDTLVEVNVRSVLRMTRIVYPILKAQGTGAIIQVGSSASTLPSYGMYCAYSATKAAAEHMAKSLKAECADKDIVIQCHVPLLVSTKLAKIRNSSYFVPSATTYAKKAVRAIENADRHSTSVLSPYFPHWLQLFVVKCLPQQVWNRFQMAEAVGIRKKAMKKLTEARHG